MARTRVRWGTLGTAAATGVLAVSLLAGRAGARPAHREAPRTFWVQPGDTVWGIARQAVGPEGDPRPVVDELVRQNHIRDAVIVPGQRLVLSSTRP